jgi:hypothetical protein
MPYREDFDAAAARVAILEHELAELRAAPPHDAAAHAEVVELRTVNHELQLELQRTRDDLLRARAVPPPRDRDRELVELAKENAALRDAAATARLELERATAPRAEPTHPTAAPESRDVPRAAYAVFFAIVACVIAALLASAPHHP